MNKHMVLAVVLVLSVSQQALAYDTDAIAWSFAAIELYDQYCSPPVSNIVKEKMKVNSTYAGVTDAQITAKLAEVRASIDKEGTVSFCQAARLGIIDPLENLAKYGSH